MSLGNCPHPPLDTKLRTRAPDEFEVEHCKVVEELYCAACGEVIQTIGIGQGERA